MEFLILILFEIGSRHGTMAPQVALTKKSTPGLFFRCRHPLGPHSRKNDCGTRSPRYTWLKLLTGTAFHTSRDQKANVRCLGESWYARSLFRVSTTREGRGDIELRQQDARYVVLVRFKILLRLDFDLLERSLVLFRRCSAFNHPWE